MNRLPQRTHLPDALFPYTTLFRSRPALERQATTLGLADRIDWHGPAAQAEVLARYRAADLFALASRVARDGDRDGLPTVLVEAQSQGLARSDEHPSELQSQLRLSSAVFSLKKKTTTTYIPQQ